MGALVKAEDKFRTRASTSSVHLQFSASEAADARVERSSDGVAALHGAGQITSVSGVTQVIVMA